MRNRVLVTMVALWALATGMTAQEFLRVFSTRNNPEPVVKNTVRYNYATKSKDRIYINTDYCSYMVIRKGARYYNALPGENLVESRPVQSQASEGNYAATNYHYWRGVFPKKDAAAGYYALPLAAGEKVVVDPHTVHFKGSEREENYMSFGVQENDTVYAMRGGVVCLSGDKKGVVINHADETFAVYHHMRRALVQPGEDVETGQPVGLAAGKEVHVGFVYLDEKYFKQKEMAEEYPYTHFLPQIWDGSQFVRYDKPAVVVAPALPDEVVTQDMTKAQKKRYMKNKNNKHN